VHPQGAAVRGRDGREPVAFGDELVDGRSRSEDLLVEPDEDPADRLTDRRGFLLDHLGSLATLGDVAETRLCGAVTDQVEDAQRKREVEHDVRVVEVDRQQLTDPA
jgi:hypothetical protein